MWREKKKQVNMKIQRLRIRLTFILGSPGSGAGAGDSCAGSFLRETWAGEVKAAS